MMLALARPTRTRCPTGAIQHGRPTSPTASEPCDAWFDVVLSLGTRWWCIRAPRTMVHAVIAHQNPLALKLL